MKRLTSILLLGGATRYGTLAFAPSANPIQQRTLAAVKTVNLDQPAADSKYCIPLDKISLDDLPKVGGKTASLGEMIQQLTPLGVAVPGGFGVTSAAYDAVLDRFELRERLELLLRDVDVNNLDDLAHRGKQARLMIMNAGLPEEVIQEIEAAYADMCLCNLHSCGKDCAVAVRSSATAEDLPTASFAGQQASFLNVVGKNSVANTVLECLASVFTDRAIAYRVHNGFDHMAVKGAVSVQLMVRSDLASSGVAFTLDPDTGFRDAIVITGSYGLGESVVGGKVDPDEIQVFKPMIGKAEDPIIKRSIGRKQTKIVYTKDGSDKRTKTLLTPDADAGRPCFSDEDAKTIAEWCVKIEDHYSRHHGHPTPMDIEWAKDGITGELYIVQARPETVRSAQKANVLKRTQVTGHEEPIMNGSAIGSDAASGIARVIRDVSEISTMKPGEILVADMTDPDWVPGLRMASGVVTNRGGRTCHAAIVSRELGVPCIVGTKDATERLKTGERYTVDCSQGSTGYVYPGEAQIERTSTDTDNLPKTKTKIKLILGDPDSALSLAGLPVDGVGLIRQEFVVANHIGIHPKAALHPELISPVDQEIINERSKNDKSPKDFFVRRLSEGVGSIAAAFYPRPVIVRLGDFKSNEYRRLVGGENFEPDEENPMIGLRGASRYLSPEFKDAFELECEALAHVRNKMGLTNVQLMVPFCRTPEEGKQVIEILKENKLEKGKDGLKIWVMCELPSNVQVLSDAVAVFVLPLQNLCFDFSFDSFAIDEFAQVFDGFSIGSNDLTQLTLGVDRDSGLLANLFDEDNNAVKTAISQAIKGAHGNGKEVGLCGQAPSDKPDFAEFLVELGIDSISLTPDSVLQAIDIVSKAEMKGSLEKEIGDAIVVDKAVEEVKRRGDSKKMGV